MSGLHTQGDMADKGVPPCYCRVGIEDKTLSSELHPGIRNHSPICPNVPILTKVRGHGCPVSGGRGHGGRHRAGIGVSGAPMQGGQGDGTQGARVGGDGVL